MDVKGADSISLDDLRKIVAPIAESYGVGKMILFGSMARGDNREGSDYDFCVDLGKIDDLVKMCGFIMELESSLGVPVDVISERTLDEDMSKEVFEDGRIIYEA
jgi:predicted nucleotidyltransferase